MEHFETWKVSPTNANYAVSDLGRVRRVKPYGNWMKPDIMKSEISNSGYERVMLSPDKKKHSVHRLVCEAFNGYPSDEKPICRHLDGDKLNNNQDNLAWGSYEENESDKAIHGTRRLGEDHPNAVLTEEVVKEIKRLLRDTQMSMNGIARALNVSSGSVWQIANNKGWRHVE